MNVSFKIIAVYSMILLVISTIGNSAGVFICLRKRLRQTPTFVFTAFALMSDVVTLYFWNVDHILYVFNYSLMEEASLQVCRIVTLIQGFSLQYSAWLLVLMSVERYLSVKIRRLRSTYLQPRAATVVSIVLGICVFTFNSIYCGFIGTDVDISSNSTCLQSKLYEKYLKINIVAYGLIPYTILFLSNVLLIQALMYNRGMVVIQFRNERRLKRRSISFTVLTVTTLFVLATLPVNILNAFFVPKLFESEQGLQLLFLADCLAFTCHGLSFLTLAVTNKAFYKEIKECFKSLTTTNRVRSF